MARRKIFFWLGFFFFLFFLFGIFSWGVVQKTLATDTTATTFYSKVKFTSKGGTYADSQNISAGDTLRVKNSIAVSSTSKTDVKFTTDSFSLQNSAWVTAPFSNTKTISSEAQFFYTNETQTSLSGNFSVYAQENLVRLKISPFTIAGANRDLWQYSKNPSILENISDKTNFFSTTGASIGIQAGGNRQIYLEAKVEAVCTVPSGYTHTDPTNYNGEGAYVFQGENATATETASGRTVSLFCGENGGDAHTIDADLVAIDRNNLSTDGDSPNLVAKNEKIELNLEIGVQGCYGVKSEDNPALESKCSSSGNSQNLAGKNVSFSLEYDTNIFEEDFVKPITATNFTQMSEWTNWECKQSPSGTSKTVTCQSTIHNAINNGLSIIGLLSNFIFKNKNLESSSHSSIIFKMLNVVNLSN